MKFAVGLVAAVILQAGMLARADDSRLNAAHAPSAGPSKKVYGEWRIQIKPDKGAEYGALIKSRGLPLFRQAGGRMVGWWTTLVGNLYEQLTIWEYDDMAAFERAIGFLAHDKRFAEFVALRDPLLAGEQNRFLTLAEHANPPSLPEPAKYVVHEVHRVPLSKMAGYLDFMSKTGLTLLKKHGFRPVGPWIVEVGDWREATYLFRFDSLDERSRLIAKFATHADAKAYSDAIQSYVDAVITRILTPAPFAAHSAANSTFGPVSSAVLPHVEQLTEGVFAAGFSDRYGSANCGWVRLAAGALLVDLPHGCKTPDFLAEVQRTAGKPAYKLALTNLQAGDELTVAALVAGSVREVVTSPSIRNRLLAAWKGNNPPTIRAVESAQSIGDETTPVELMPLDGIAAAGGAAIHLPGEKVLFAGPLVVNGPRTRLPGSDSQRWIAALSGLEKCEATAVVPAFGSWGGPDIVRRERRFLSEIRRQVSYLVSQGRSESVLKHEIRIPADFLVWMPYDTPTLDDLEHVYGELTVPFAPFSGQVPDPAGPIPHALVLVGDQPHEPGHLIDGLRPAFESVGVTPHFAVDVRALTADNLAKVRLLVILRDGMQRPTDDPAANYVWMTREQQSAIERFVMEGGSFLNLHNSMGLYPPNGPYLKLVGGRYIGHGPLERFRTEVVDDHHPVTHGVQDFWTADEQHTPPYDSSKLHLLLRNRSDDNKVVAAAGWVYEPGRGRLCHLANGHTRDALQHPMYQRLLRNAINWCLRRDVK